MSNKELTSKIDRLREMRAEIDQKQKEADRLSKACSVGNLKRLQVDCWEMPHYSSQDQFPKLFELTMFI